MEPEFYYHDALRWSFGFANPNKGAIIFMCLLPLLWLGWRLCWRLRSRCARVSALLLAATMILADAFCLFKTYSRGGAIGSFVALLYLSLSLLLPLRLWKWGHLLSSHKVLAEAALFVGIMSMFTGFGLGARFLEVTHPRSNGSMENRIQLWQSAMQMAVEQPHGFGIGNSAETYSQWYQPVEITVRYKNMVNSYLTFLVEQGWPIFAVTIFGLCMFWVWVFPAKTSGHITAGFELSVALRASILAFLVGGIFSTTMEEPILWVIPSACALILLIWTIMERKPWNLNVLFRGSSLAFSICMLLWLAGWLRESSDGLIRKFKFEKDDVVIVELQAKNGKGAEWVIVPDNKVLGRLPGKLFRRLCLGIYGSLRFDPPSEVTPTAALILVGNSVQGNGTDLKARKLVLLAPAIVAEDKARKLLENNPNALVLLPEIDEDGRCGFWQEIVEKSPSHPKIVQLPGVGLQVDWAWDQVIAAIKGV